MPVPESSDLTIQAVAFNEGIATIDWYEEDDVHKTTMLRRQLTVALEEVPEEAQDALTALRDLLSAAQVAHRNPPDRIRQR